MSNSMVLLFLLVVETKRRKMRTPSMREYVNTKKVNLSKLLISLYVHPKGGGYYY